MAQNYPFECDVLVGDTPVGVLSLHENRKVSFHYHGEYIANGGKSISPHMPITEEDQIYDGLPPFFSNLLSEGWLRAQHNHALKLMKVEDALERQVVTGFDILAFLGTTALRGGRVRPRQKFPRQIWDTLKQIKVETAAGKSILAGVQPKLFVNQDPDGVYHSCDPENATHIAKTDFAPGDEKEAMRNITANEFVTTAASRALTPEDAIAETTMGTVWEFVPAQSLLSKRFDIDDNGRVYRMLDFGQLLDIPPERRMDASYAQIAEFIDRHADDPEGSDYKTDRRDIEIFARRLCRNILLGNLDTHLKNFSLMEQNGVWRMSPDYDLVHSRIYGDYTLALHVDMPAETIDNRGTTKFALDARERVKPTVQSLRHGKKICRLLTTLGISSERQAIIIQELLDNLPAAREVIANCPVGDDVLKRSLLKNMDARRREDFEPALELAKQLAQTGSFVIDPSQPIKKTAIGARTVPIVP